MPCTCLRSSPSLLGVSLRLPCVPFRGDLSHFSHRRKQQQRPRHKSVRVRPSLPVHANAAPARTWRRCIKFPPPLPLFDDP